MTVAKTLPIRFVLVRPGNALNMGAAARALSNFGFDDMVAVEPKDENWRLASASAIYASELLRRAPVMSLEEAIADCSVVIGTASDHNREVRQPRVTLPALAPWLRRKLKAGGKAAVLFGSETAGLNNEEVGLCSAILRIPTAPDAPSMNLGQAVAVIAYQLSRFKLEKAVTRSEDPLLEGRQAKDFTELALRAMERTGMNHHLSPAQKRLKFRSGLMRWSMTRADASFLSGLLKRLMGEG
ncbi:hypothetical protein EPO15_15340 [bacterium]|nr:MAG: hypothetical protein EPO15_15340 [bacterium]